MIIICVEKARPLEYDIRKQYIGKDIYTHSQTRKRTLEAPRRWFAASTRIGHYKIDHHHCYIVGHGKRGNHAKCYLVLGDKLDILVSETEYILEHLHG